jgi:hypothetical protein
MPMMTPPAPALALVLVATTFLAGCNGGNDAAAPEPKADSRVQDMQVTLPMNLDNRAIGIGVRSDGTVVAAEVALGEQPRTSTTSDEPGRIVALPPNAPKPEVLSASTPAPVATAMLGDDLYAGELNRIESGTSSSFDDEYRFQIRVFRAGGSEVIPFDIPPGTSKLDEVDAIAVAPSGEIYVCAGGSFDQRLLRLSKGQTTPVVVEDRPGCGDGLAVNSKGDVYALEDEVMVKYPSGGAPVGVWMPAVIQPVRFTIGPGDSIYVVDNGSSKTGQRVVKFTDGSTNVATIPFVATINGSHAIAVADNGDVVLGDDDQVFRLRNQ